MNQTAIAFIKAKETCRLTAYQDQGGVWTCGWGTTGPDIGHGTTWTQAQADQRFLDRYLPTEVGTRKAVTVHLTEGQEAALISFAYNCGLHALQSSTLLTVVNRGEWRGIGQAFASWDHVGQQENKGLYIRRLEEAILFLTHTP